MRNNFPPTIITLLFSATTCAVHKASLYEITFDLTSTYRKMKMYEVKAKLSQDMMIYITMSIIIYASFRVLSFTLPTCRPNFAKAGHTTEKVEQA
jgi:hypothetical protein